MLYAGPTLHPEVFLHDLWPPSEDGVAPLMKLRFNSRVFPIVNVQSKSFRHPSVRFVPFRRFRIRKATQFQVCLAWICASTGFLNLPKPYSSRILPDLVSYQVHPEGLDALPAFLFVVKLPKKPGASISPSRVLHLDDSTLAPLGLGCGSANSPEHRCVGVVSSHLMPMIHNEPYLLPTLTIWSRNYIR